MLWTAEDLPGTGPQFCWVVPLTTEIQRGREVEGDICSVQSWSEGERGTWNWRDFRRVLCEYSFSGTRCIET